MVYKICDHCQARLDPGERCDCREEVPSQEETARTSGGNVHKDHNKKEEQHYE